MDKPKFIYVTYIKADPEKVWEGLMKPEFTQQYWMGTRIESDWKVGSPVIFHGPDKVIPGTVLLVDPPRRLSYTWDIPTHAGIEGERGTRVTFELSKAGAVTKLTVLHEGFAPDSPWVDRVSQGWPAVLASLKSLLETGEAFTPDFCQKK